MRKRSACLFLVGASVLRCTAFSSTPDDGSGAADAAAESGFDAGSEADLDSGADAACDDACVPVTVFSEPDANFWGLAVVPPLVFVTNNQGYNTPSYIERGSIGGTSLDRVATFTTAPTGLAADDVNVYFATLQDGSLHSLKHDGTVVNAVPTGSLFARACVAVAPDGNGLYFTFNSEVRTYVYGAPSIETVMANGNSVVGVAASSTSLFWTSKGDGTVWTSTLDGSAPAMLASGQQAPACMVLDGPDTLYWTDTLRGQIMSLSISKKTQNIIAHGENSPIGIAVTSDSIWWTAGDAVRRVAK